MVRIGWMDGGADRWMEGGRVKKEDNIEESWEDNKLIVMLKCISSHKNVIL